LLRVKWRLSLQKKPETDCRLGKDGKRRRNSEDLTGSPNKSCSQKLPKPDTDAMDEDNNPDLNLMQLEVKSKAKKES
jgi:hypothetical protein